MLKSRNVTHVCKRLLCEMALKWYPLVHLLACWNLKTNEKDKVRFLVVGEDLTPDCLALTTQKINQLTVHKVNFSNVVGNANDDLTVK